MANSLKNTVNELIRIFLLVPLGNIIATSLRVTQLGDIVGNLLVTTTSTSLVLTNAVNIAMGTSTGSQIGTAASQKIGFWGGAPVVQATDGAAIVNNVTVGGTTNQIDDFTNLTVYATDATAIQNDIYQLARKVKIIDDALRLYGMLS